MFSCFRPLTSRNTRITTDDKIAILILQTTPPHNLGTIENISQIQYYHDILLAILYTLGGNILKIYTRRSTDLAMQYGTHVMRHTQPIFCVAAHPLKKYTVLTPIPATVDIIELDNNTIYIANSQLVLCYTPEIQESCQSMFSTSTAFFVITIKEYYKNFYHSQPILCIYYPMEMYYYSIKIYWLHVGMH